MDIFEQVAEMRAKERVQEVKEEIIRNLLTYTNLSLKKIASVAELSLPQVEKIKDNLLVHIITRSANS